MTESLYKEIAMGTGGIASDADKDRLQLALCAMWQMLSPTGKDLPIETQRAYLVALRYLEIADVERAIERLMRTATFFPKPAEIRAACGVSELAQVYTAWEQLREALAKYGTADLISFNDPVLATTVRAMGGLSVLANTAVSDFESFGWHRFKETYSTMAASNQFVIGLEFKTSSHPTGEPRRLSIGGQTQPGRIASEAARLVEIKKP